MRRREGGATITATQNGAKIGKATTARDGTWEIPLPGPGRYTITLDVAHGTRAAEAAINQAIVVLCKALHARRRLPPGGQPSRHGEVVA